MPTVTPNNSVSPNWPISLKLGRAPLAPLWNPNKNGHLLLLGHQNKGRATVLDRVITKAYCSHDWEIAIVDGTGNPGRGLVAKEHVRRAHETITSIQHATIPRDTNRSLLIIAIGIFAAVRDAHPNITNQWETISDAIKNWVTNAPSNVHLLIAEENPTTLSTLLDKKPQIVNVACDKLSTSTSEQLFGNHMGTNLTERTALFGSKTIPATLFPTD